jgi:hypothetical protein
MIFFVEETDVCRVFRDSETWWTTTVGSAPICSQTVTRLTPYGFNSSRYEAKTLDCLFECALSEVSPLRVNQEVPTAPPAILLSATVVVLIFTDQKNAVRGETVGHSRSVDPHACPVLATVCHILHLRSFNFSPTTPLCTLTATGHSISPAAITDLLRQGGLAFYLVTNTTIPPIHQKALRATGASTLLAQGAKYSTIKLTGQAFLRTLSSS